MAYTLRITDGDWAVSFTNTDSGWIVLGNSDGWAPRASLFKGGGFYSDSLMAHGSQLRHAVFDNVIESWQSRLSFETIDIMLNQINMLQELLQVRAPRYWLERRWHTPVWVERQLEDETNKGYALLNQGNIALPGNAWDEQWTHDPGELTPVLVTLDRQPFWLGGPPGRGSQ